MATKDYTTENRLNALIANMCPPADTTLYIFNTAALVRSTNSWSIPANTAQPGSVYTVHAEGSGLQGTTAQAITMAADLGGVTTGTGITTVSNLAINDPFRWVADATACCNTAGSSAGWFLSLTLTLTNDTTNAGFSLTSSQGATILVPSNVAIPFYIAMGWAATVGGPAGSCLWSQLRPSGLTFSP